MPKESKPGKPTTRRYTDSEKDRAVRLVRKPCEELGTDHGTVQRVANQLGYGVESVRTCGRERDVVDGVVGPDSLREHELDQRNKEHEQELRETRRADEIMKGLDFLRGGARPPIEVIVGFVDEHRDQFGVEPIAVRCKRLRARTTPPNAARPRRQRVRSGTQR